MKMEQGMMTGRCEDGLEFNARSMMEMEYGHYIDGNGPMPDLSIIYQVPWVLHPLVSNALLHIRFRSSYFYDDVVCTPTTNPSFTSGPGTRTGTIFGSCDGVFVWFA